MSLGDVSGVFSRYFVVGFFAPAFFGLFAVAQFATSDLYPAWFEPRTEVGVLVVGGLALLVGLLLEGLNYPVLRLFEGYPLLSRRLLRPLGHWLKARRVAEYETLASAKALAQSDVTSEAERKRGASAWWQLDASFPPVDHVLPTRFGNAIRAFESYSKDRWGLDAIPVWPRIEALLSEQERDLHAAAKTDVAFFLNSVVAAFLIGGALIVDAAINQPLHLGWTWIYALPFALAFLFYNFAIDAARRWGTEVRSSIDLHRLELYERLGLRAPQDIDDERQIGVAVTNLLLYGISPPKALWRQTGTRESR